MQLPVFSIPFYGKGLCLSLFLITAVVGDPVSASDDGMQQMHPGHSMSGHATMEHSAHGMMPHDVSPMMSMESEHAAHHQMMQRQGYTRSVHSYATPDLTLLDQQGAATSLTEQLDTHQPVMLNFIFTTCTTICPVLSATFSQIQEQLGSEIASVRMISITIDPEQDRPEQLRAYAERYQAGPQWRFLTGDIENVIAVQKAFDIYRGSKTNHRPITLLRGSGAAKWVRIDGIASANEIIDEYRTLSMAQR